MCERMNQLLQVHRGMMPLPTRLSTPLAAGTCAVHFLHAIHPWGLFASECYVGACIMQRSIRYCWAGQCTVDVVHAPGTCSSSAGEGNCRYAVGAVGAISSSGCPRGACMLWCSAVCCCAAHNQSQNFMPLGLGRTWPKTLNLHGMGVRWLLASPHPCSLTPTRSLVFIVGPSLSVLMLCKSMHPFDLDLADLQGSTLSERRPRHVLRIKGRAWKAGQRAVSSWRCSLWEEGEGSIKVSNKQPVLRELMQSTNTVIT